MAGKESRPSGRLRLDFEGFWQCRLATDPDPTREPRGASGYVFAVGYESDLDGVIRLQCDEIEPRDFRQPFPPYRTEETERFGVFVTRVELDGAPVSDHPLVGAAVRLLDEPRFALRNQIVGDGINRLVPPIVPFHVRVEKDGIVLSRDDPLDPEHPDREIWQLDPEVYQRRVPVNYFHVGDESVLAVLGEEADADTDQAFNTFFQKRKDWLLVQLARVRDPVEREAMETRLFSIETHTAEPGEPPGVMENRLGLQTVWDFPIAGDKTRIESPERLGATVLAGREHSWHTRFWMGGWDGDLLVGYLKGYLELPVG